MDGSTGSIIASYQISSRQSLKLTQRHLSVAQKQREKSKHIPLQYIQGITLHFKKLMFPIVSGGIIAPLSAVSTYSHTLPFWVGMTSTLIGSLLVYYGWQGAYQIKINLGKTTVSLFTDRISSTTHDFLQKANRTLQTNRGFSS